MVILPVMQLEIRFFSYARTNSKRINQNCGYRFEIPFGNDKKKQKKD